MDHLERCVILELSLTMLMIRSKSRSSRIIIMKRNRMRGASLLIPIRYARKHTMSDISSSIPR
jgi:hypothetical protein